MTQRKITEAYKNFVREDLENNKRILIRSELQSLVDANEDNLTDEEQKVIRLKFNEIAKAAPEDKIVEIIQKYQKKLPTDFDQMLSDLDEILGDDEYEDENENIEDIEPKHEGMKESIYAIKDAYRKLVNETFAGPIPSTGAITTDVGLGNPFTDGFGPGWGGYAQGGTKPAQKRTFNKKKKKKKKKSGKKKKK
jgi:nitrate reductase NapAB chaperone NapD